MSKRDEFTRKQKNNYLSLNAAKVRRRWLTEFSGKADHYMCENCGFVHNNREYFQVDHIFPCAAGGRATRFNQQDYRQILAGDVALLYQLGDNAMVLCRGCNGAKKDKLFIPEGRGYAFRSPYREMDRNPDHLYYGGAAR